MLMFLSIFILSCGGGSDGGSDDVITPPIQTVDPPSMATLNSPTNNKVCEEGTSVSETQSNVNFQWTAGSNTDSYDLRITNLNSDQVINQSTNMFKGFLTKTSVFDEFLILAHRVKEKI